MRSRNRFFFNPRGGVGNFSIELCRLKVLRTYKIFARQWPNSRRKRGLSAHTAGQDPDKDPITTALSNLGIAGAGKIDFEPFYRPFVPLPNRLFP